MQSVNIVFFQYPSQLPVGRCRQTTTQWNYITIVFEYFFFSVSCYVKLFKRCLGVDCNIQFKSKKTKPIPGTKQQLLHETAKICQVTFRQLIKTRACKMPFVIILPTWWRLIDSETRDRKVPQMADVFLFKFAEMPPSCRLAELIVVLVNLRKIMQNDQHASTF